RLALILHTLDTPYPTAVSKEAMQGATRLGEYFKSHARRAYLGIDYARQSSDPVDRNFEDAIVATIASNGPTTTTDLHRRFRNRVPAGKLARALDNLVKVEVLEHLELPATGGRGGKSRSVYTLTGDQSSQNPGANIDPAANNARGES